MNCTRCGKQISGGKNLCNDCALSALTKAAESVQATKEPIYTAPPAPAEPKSSFGLSLVAFILSCVALFGSLMLIASSLYNALLAVVLFIAPIALSIIFGSISFKKSKIYTENGMRKDTRTFIFGLIGFVQGLATVRVLFISYALLLNS